MNGYDGDAISDQEWGQADDDRFNRLRAEREEALIDRDYDEEAKRHPGAEIGCIFPGRCLVEGRHWTDECRTEGTDEEATR